jgi:formate dehydrogenase assembly factor FdhD
MKPLRFLWRMRVLATKGVPAPYKLAARRPVTLIARGAMETALVVERRTPFDLKELAMGRVASLIGCTW